MDLKALGQVLIIFGLLGLTIKLIEVLAIYNGGLITHCFGIDYLYESLTLGIPILLLVIGCKLYVK